MSSEQSNPPNDPDDKSQANASGLRHEAKLVRSASENCDLALCWAKGQPATSKPAAELVIGHCEEGHHISSSVSLQEIASFVSNAIGHVSIDERPSVSFGHNSNPNSPPAIVGPNSPPVFTTHSTTSTCVKQTDIHIPDTVFEDKMSSSTEVKVEMNPKASSTTAVACKGCSHNAAAAADDDVDVDQIFFFWSHEEAEEKQIEQIGASACGATAILNVMNVLDLKPDLQTVAGSVKTNQRAEDAPLPEYLFSRSVAGATHEALIEGLEKSTDGQVYARFFALHPERKVDLKRWLVSWMRQGVIPLATLNLQVLPVNEDGDNHDAWHHQMICGIDDNSIQGVIPLATLNLQVLPVNEDGDIHDAWHHQMIYGVDDNSIHMCNPIIAETVDRIQQQLCSEAVLLVRRFDVLKRWHKNTNLSALALHEDTWWRDLDVLGQAVNMLLDDPPTKHNTGDSDGDERRYEKELTDWFMRTHIRIPAAYTSGITLIVRKDNKNGYRNLKEARDLPLLK